MSPTQATHWHGCWKADGHAQCAREQIRLLLRVLREIDRAAQEYAPMGTIKVLSGSALLHYVGEPFDE